MTPQAVEVLNHLTEKRTDGLSPLEAIGLYRIFRLSARIFELKTVGYGIKTVLKQDRLGKRYARYYLI